MTDISQMFPKTRRVHSYSSHNLIQSFIYSTILILFMKDDCYRLSELSGFDDPAALLPLPQTPLPSLETAITPSDVTALLPAKEDLRFTTVESAPPTDSLMSTKLSQYVEEPFSSSSSSIQMADSYDFEVAINFTSIVFVNVCNINFPTIAN